MEFVRKFLGFQDKPTGEITFSASPDSNNVEEKSKENILKPTPVPPFLSERFPWLENAFRVREGDCASCKYIGVTTSYGIGLFLLTQLNKPPKELAGKKLQFYSIVIPLSIVFFTLGSSRLFDVGMCKPYTGDKRKTIYDMAKEDFNDLVQYFDSKIAVPHKESNVIQNTTNNAVKKE
ncbi:uncharacterized protein LOC115222645 [Argonauta hians]